ncbi:MAG: hypothetical protein FJZ63_00545 [Chlamydiae bacterium]|nr:hypothetical protein [Chlamydiota bacterium]
MSFNVPTVNPKEESFCSIPLRSEKPLSKEAQKTSQEAFSVFVPPPWLVPPVDEAQKAKKTVPLRYVPITAEQNNAFFDLIALVWKSCTKDSSVVSPISLAAVMDMKTMGALYDLPLKEMTQALNKSEPQAKGPDELLENGLPRSKKDKRPPVDDDMVFKSMGGGNISPEHRQYLGENGIEVLDGINIAAINEEIATLTHQKIINFLPEDDYRSIFLNAFYLKRSWEHKFFQDSHSPGEFTPLNHPEGQAPDRVKTIKTSEAHYLQFAQAEKNGCRLNLVAIPCENDPALNNNVPTTYAILAIPEGTVTKDTVHNYEDALLSSFADLKWESKNVTITMPKFSVRERIEDVGAILAQHSDARVRVAVQTRDSEKFITETCLECTKEGMEGAAATGWMSLGAGFEIDYRLNADRTYFVIPAIKVKTVIDPTPSSAASSSSDSSESQPVEGDKAAEMFLPLMAARIGDTGVLQLFDEKTQQTT